MHVDGGRAGRGGAHRGFFLHPLQTARTAYFALFQLRHVRGKFIPPVAGFVNGAILVGRRIAGIPGLIVAVLATILPPIVIISIISMMYAVFAENEWVRAVLTGMQSGVAAVICDVTANLGGKVVQSKDWLNLLLMAGAFVASAVFHVNVIVVILVAAAIGVVRALLARKGGVSA